MIVMTSHGTSWSSGAISGVASLDPFFKPRVTAVWRRARATACALVAISAGYGKTGAEGGAR
jgi:hypothetical protein